MKKLVCLPIVFLVIMTILTRGQMVSGPGAIGSPDQGNAFRSDAKLFIEKELASAGNAAGISEKLDALIEPLAKANEFSGVVLASRDGKVIYEKAFGLANADFNIPNTTNTRIGIASITKLMTITILLQLVDAKKIALNDKLSKYIPDFPEGNKITIDMLFHHRSGIPHRVMPPEFETVPYTSAEMVEKVKQAKLAFEPGSARLYSSAGYAVLARVLEIASGRSYAQLLKEFVFDLAGMRDSVEFDSQAIMERRAQDYLLDASGYENAALKDYSFLIGAGSVFSTAKDIHNFGMAAIDGKYGKTVKDALVDEGVVNGSGNTNGHRAYFELKSDKSYGYVILSNLACGGFDFVQKGMGEILQGKELSVPKIVIPKIIPNPNKDLHDFVGPYKAKNGSEIEISIKRGFLYSSDIKMFPTRPDCFFDYKFFGEACFKRDASGNVTDLTWKGIGFELKWTKQ